MPAVQLVDVETARARTDALYRRHRRSVTRTCRALLRDRVEAEDAAQEVFLSAHRAILAGVVPREPAAWLATIARHECWARIRMRMFTPTTAGTDAAEQGTLHFAPDPLRGAEVAALWGAIAELPKAQRDALLLREIRGLSYDQLARHLALSPPSIRSLLERARRRIRLRLRDVHTAVSGIPWLDAAARLLAGGSNPAAPVARVAALGLGAAAITGGAIVTPTMLEHHVRPPVVRKATAPHHASARVEAAHRTRPHVSLGTPRARVVLVDRRTRRNRGEHRPAEQTERAEHDGIAGVTDGEGGNGSDGSRGSPSPTQAVRTGSSSGKTGGHASDGDSHGGETTTTNSGPGATSTLSPVIAAPIVSSGGGSDSHDGGTSSGSGERSGGDGSSGSTDLAGSHGSDGSDGH